MLYETLSPKFIEDKMFRDVNPYLRNNPIPVFWDWLWEVQTAALGSPKCGYGSPAEPRQD